MENIRTENQEPPIKIKTETKDLDEYVPKPVVQTVCQAPAPSRTNTSGQQKITNYFNQPNSKVIAAPVKDENESDRKTPPLDSDSVKGVFGWVSFGSVHLPYILRRGERYAAVRIIESKLLKKFLQALPPDVYSCTYIKSYFITENEAKLLNEINIQHCDYQFGYEQFTPKDLVVRLDDANQFYEFLETCYAKLVEPASLKSKSSRCGFIKLNGTVMPYIMRDGIKYVPLTFFEQELESLKMKAEKLEPWELSYIKFCCKVAGMNSDLFTSQGCPIVPLDDIKQHSNEAAFLEDWWPSDKKPVFLKSNNEHDINSLNNRNMGMSHSVFQMPQTAVSKSSLKGMLASQIDKKQEIASNFNSQQLKELSENTSLPGRFHILSSSQTVPSVPPSHWSSPQPFLFSGQWWGPLNTSLAPSLKQTSNPASSMFPPTEVLKPDHSVNNSSQNRTSLQQAVLPSLENTAQSQVSEILANAGKQNYSHYLEANSRFQPPPLIKNMTSNTYGSVQQYNGIRSKVANPETSLPTSSTEIYQRSMFPPPPLIREESVITPVIASIESLSSSFNNSSNRDPANEKSSSSRSDSDLYHSAKSALYHKLTEQRNNSYENNRIAQRLKCDPPYGSVVPISTNSQNMVIAPGIHQSISPQASPKPANQVPAMNSSPNFPGRPPPPLIPAKNVSIIPISPQGSIMNRNLSAIAGSVFPAVSGSNEIITSQLSPSLSPIAAANKQGFLGSAEAPGNISVVTQMNTPEIMQTVTVPFKLHLKQVDDKNIPVINIKPYIYDKNQLVSLQDVVETFFPSLSVDSCHHVLTEVLGVTVQQCNRSQQLVYAKYSEDRGKNFVNNFIAIEDLINFMPQLKYMFSRMDDRFDKSSSVSEPSPKRTKTTPLES